MCQLWSENADRLEKTGDDDNDDDDDDDDGVDHDDHDDHHVDRDGDVATDNQGDDDVKVIVDKDTILS